VTRSVVPAVNVQAGRPGRVRLAAGQPGDRMSETGEYPDPSSYLPQFFELADPALSAA
jgi:hypothetical protein